MSELIVGSFEIVSLPELGLETVVAKIDTGAFSGAVHCTEIQVSGGNQPVLSFTPAGQSGLSHQTTNFTTRAVRSSNGQKVERYIITTDIVIGGKTYQTRIGLSDRSDMKKQILIGRRFLRQYNMLVDVTRNTEYDDEKEL